MEGTNAGKKVNSRAKFEKSLRCDYSLFPESGLISSGEK